MNYCLQQVMLIARLLGQPKERCVLENRIFKHEALQAVIVYVPVLSKSRDSELTFDGLIDIIGPETTKKFYLIPSFPDARPLLVFTEIIPIHQ